ncbi:MAG TPA: hypothetical protein VNF73_08385 [Candidatus Saccharimonadales bacterium]|nr:hypothetical protein [Candidatus Saccharimonadales bacterium]
MRNRVATLAAMTALALALSAAPALAGTPAEHFWSMPAAGLTFDCGSTSIQTTSGTMNYVTRSADTASGNWSLTGTITMSGVVAVDPDGNQYAVVGSAHFGYSYNAQTGVVFANIDGHDVSEAVTTFKFQFVSKDGGLAGSLSFVQHGSPNGNYLELSPGSCTFG